MIEMDERIALPYSIERNPIEWTFVSLYFTYTYTYAHKHSLSVLSYTMEIACFGAFWHAGIGRNELRHFSYLQSYI